ncbi:MAG: hypothetical protein WC796_01010 [Candidatus Pacearchaeota archaeon]|jgi:hypothetical protein
MVNPIKKVPFLIRISIVIILLVLYLIISILLKLSSYYYLSILCLVILYLIFPELFNLFNKLFKKYKKEKDQKALEKEAIKRLKNSSFEKEVIRFTTKFTYFYCITAAVLIALHFVLTFWIGPSLQKASAAIVIPYVIGFCLSFASVSIFSLLVSEKLLFISYKDQKKVELLEMSMQMLGQIKNGVTVQYDLKKTNRIFIKASVIVLILWYAFLILLHFFM